MKRELRVYLTFALLSVLLFLSIIFLIIRAYRAQLYFEHKKAEEPLVQDN